MAGPVAEVEKAVKRPHWEPRHEWESRVKFVEDNVGDHGLEKAIALSIVWANMTFLGCSYPSGTEKLVGNYQAPSFDELRARRRAKEALKRGTSDCGSPTNSKRAKLEETVADVSSLISTIRSQSERNDGGGFVPEYDEKLSKRVPQTIQAVANAVCICQQCIGGEDVSTAEKAKSVLQTYADSKDDSFNFEFKEDQEGGNGYKCSLLINKQLVVEKTASEQEEARGFVSAEVLKMADDWQEAHRKPSCPKLATQGASSRSRYTEEYDGTPSRYSQSGYNQGRGNSYNHQRGEKSYNSYQSPCEQRSRYSSEYFMPPPARPPSGGRYSGSDGRGYNRGGRGYRYNSSRY